MSSNKNSSGTCNRINSSDGPTNRSGGACREVLETAKQEGVGQQYSSQSDNHVEQVQHHSGIGMAHSHSANYLVGGEGSNSHLSMHSGPGSPSPSNMGMIGHDFTAEDLQDLFGSVAGVDTNDDLIYREGGSFSIGGNFHQSQQQQQQQHHHHENSILSSSSGLHNVGSYQVPMNVPQGEGRTSDRANESTGIRSNASTTAVRTTSNSKVGMLVSVERGGYDRQCSSASVNAQSDGNQSDCGGLGGEDMGSDGKLLARTERKRSREKQRRSDVNKQFYDLTACLRQVESEYDSEELRAASLPTVFSPSNRADLLARTVALLTALNNSNTRRKKEIADLKHQLDSSKQAGEEMAQKLKESLMAPQNMGGNKVMVMVPMMLGNDGTQHPMMQPTMLNPNSGVNPMWGMHQMNPTAQSTTIPTPFQFMMPSSSVGPNGATSNTGTPSTSANAQHQQTYPTMMNMTATTPLNGTTASSTQGSVGAAPSAVAARASTNVNSATAGGSSNNTSTSAISQSIQQQLLLQQQHALMTQLPQWGMMQHGNVPHPLQQQHQLLLQHQQHQNAMQQMPFMMMPPPQQQQQQFMPQMMMPAAGLADANAATAGVGVSSVSSSTSMTAAPNAGMMVQQHQHQSVMNSNTSSPSSSHNSSKTEKSDPNVIGGNLAHCA
jgi:hypothetical protein